jgi:hypothetical protein
MVYENMPGGNLSPEVALDVGYTLRLALDTCGQQFNPEYVRKMERISEEYTKRGAGLSDEVKTAIWKAQIKQAALDSYKTDYCPGGLGRIVRALQSSRMEKDRETIQALQKARLLRQIKRPD